MSCECSISPCAHQQEAWELRQLLQPIDWEGVQIDPAPFQLVERTSLHKVRKE